MGDVIQWGLTCFISQRITLYPHYPHEPAERWEVVNTGFGYNITERAVEMTVSIMNKLIFEHSTDLVIWFASWLWEEHRARTNHQYPNHNDASKRYDEHPLNGSTSPQGGLPLDDSVEENTLNFITDVESVSTLSDTHSIEDLDDVDSSSGSGNDPHDKLEIQLRGGMMQHDIDLWLNDMSVAGDRMLGLPVYGVQVP